MSYRIIAAILLLGGSAHGAMDRGEMLIDQLSCTQCHSAAAQAGDRFMTRPGAELGAQGLRITPEWLRQFLANPDAVQPGTAMPDMLHGLAPDEKAGAVEDLTHYLLSIEPSGEDVFEWDPALIAKGRGLYHTLGCVACHAPFELPPRVTDDQRGHSEMQEIQNGTDTFRALPSMMAVPQLAAFLRDPVRFHPAGRMPSMKLGDAEATAIAAYLLRDQTPQNPGNLTVPGVRYEYFEERSSALPNFDRLRVKAVGTVPTFNLSPRKRDESIALRYRGLLNVPAEGEYQFYTESDDGSKLLIDDNLVIDNDGIHAMKEMSGRIVLTRGEHAITVLYFNGAADFGLKVSWEGPGIVKEEIPAAALTHPGARMVPTGGGPFTVDAARAARGRALFAQFNCAACHQGEMPGTKAPALADLTLDRKDDCIGDAPAKGLPHYTLTPDERDAIRQTLRDKARLSQPLDPHALVDRTMTVLNCYACHNRDQEGGAEGLRREYFSSSSPEVDLGDEGTIPPRLTGVGGKLQESWIGKVLWEGAAVRPYMATHMPQFGRDNVGFLPAAFHAADGAGVVNPVLQGDAMMAKAGRKLVGVTGVGCIACHTFADHPSLGVPAIDLTWMTERLQTGWFHSYLIDPQSLRPGTRMPSFWPDGKAVNHEVLGGDTDKQIAAIWTYLLRGKSADLPDGLVHGKMELVADKTAVMYRNFIAGAGTRGIGVGYPEKANLAFDASQMRIALIWQGSFLDVAPHRTGRGMGAVIPPMGHDVLSGPPGAPFAQLAAAGDPWPNASGREAGYQFRGYRLDDLLRPAFSYDYGDIHVTDYSVGVPGRGGAGLKRTLVFQAANPPANLYMRAAQAGKIEAAPGGGYLVDDRLTLRFSEPGATIRQSQGKMELLVPVRFTGNKASIEEDFTW
jgi:mono/diheme cytochrome c family protein